MLCIHRQHVVSLPLDSDHFVGDPLLGRDIMAENQQPLLGELPGRYSAKCPGTKPLVRATI